MPKFPKNFGRRKSTPNVLDTPVEAPVQSTFKVFERPQPGGHKSNPSFDGGVKFARNIAPADSQKDNNIFAGMKASTTNRGSGASNSNTASTTDNSSRLSAASTAPSSMEVPGHEDWRTLQDRPHSDIPIPPVPRNSSGFSLKAAGRTLSWGRNKSATPSPSKALDERPPSPVIREDPIAGRERAITASSYASTAPSYASTATPPKLPGQDLDLSVGDDFGDMFAGMSHRKSAVLDTPPTRFTKSPDILPPEPAHRSFTAARVNQPSPLVLDQRKQVDQPQYSWGSNDGLLNTSPPPVVPRHNYHAPTVPRHGPLHQSDGNQAIPRPRSSRQDSGLKRSSALSVRRQSTLEYNDGVDEDARLLQESVNASRHLNETSPNPAVRMSWAMPPSPKIATPKTKLLEPEEDENLFEDADLAQRFQERPPSPPPATNAPGNKVMTPAQFERYRQDQDRLRMVGGRPKDDADEDEEIYDDEEDEAEKNKKVVRQRRQQEAHMAVYRQQMMKVTGESTPPPSVRPQVMASQSTPNLMLSDATEDGEEEDEEIPLGILAAHGFPNKNKPPTHRLSSMGSNPNLRGQAQAVPQGIGGPLPVFARHLPQDPYIGAGLVHPGNRESLAFAGGAGSVHGSQGRGGPPGGLVGVIATEERSRAMRRGSPNTQGGYGPVPPGGFNNMGMPQPGMGHLGMGQMGPMMGQMQPQPMLTPGDQAQIRMTEQMQQFMQMQMQFMQMMSGNQGAQGSQPTGAPQLGPLGQLGAIGHMSQPNFGEMQRPLSQQQMPTSHSANSLRPDSAINPRAMTMLEAPNSLPWMQNSPGYAGSVRAQGNGYAPSIAPSERSNIGLPGRYRPVSQMPMTDNKSRTSTMSGALGGWDSKHASTTIKTVQQVSNDDEDDEEGWAEMQKKREQKRSLWKSKKDPNGLQGMLGFTQ